MNQILEQLNNKFGISIAELMIAVALLSVISGISYSSVSDSLKSQTAKEGTAKIASAVKHAKYYARSKGVVTSLTMTVGSYTYSIQANGSELTDSNVIGATSGSFSENTAILSNSCSVLYFNSAGTLTDAAGNSRYTDCSITLGYSGGPYKTITIRALTGNVEYD